MKKRLAKNKRVFGKIVQSEINNKSERKKSGDEIVIECEPRIKQNRIKREQVQSKINLRVNGFLYEIV